MSTILNTIASYLEDLTATNVICSELGTLLSANVNLFMGTEKHTDSYSVTLVPYGGAPPLPDRQRQESSVQILVKANREKAITVQQQIINHLSYNDLKGGGRMFCVNSAPLLVYYNYLGLGDFEGGEWSRTVSNFTIKHVKA